MRAKVKQMKHSVRFQMMGNYLIFIDEQHIENVISKTINFPRGFKAGTKNNIKMILGISEVALSGEVEEWETGTDLVDYWPKNKE